MEPRLITKAEAAAYCGLSTKGFSDWVNCGKVPGPIPQTRRWDRVALDAALDRLSKIETNPAPVTALEEWREKRRARGT